MTTNKKIQTSKKTKVTTVKTTTKKQDKEYNYWTADFIGDDIVIGKPLTYNEAILRVEQKGNIMCSDKSYAKSVAEVFPNYIGPEINKIKKTGVTYYYHFHINDKHGSPHIFFYGM